MNTAFWLIRGVVGLLAGGSTYDDFLSANAGKSFRDLAATDPGVASLVNLLIAEASIFMLVFGLIGMAVSRVSFRRGERWSWYVLWCMPASLVGLMALRVSVAGTAVDALVVFIGLLLAIVLLGLLLPYRKFFPKEQVVA